MVEWPSDPVATMWVPNFPPLEGGEPAAVHWAQNLSNLQTVGEATLSWSIDCTYYDGAWIDHGQGFFRADLLRLEDSGSWTRVDRQELLLGTDKDSLTWIGRLTVSATMVAETETFLLSLSCETRNTWPSYDDASSFTFMAIQDTALMGTFKLDYVPISIVYDPPGQDMTASLTQSLEYGTRMTIGRSSGFNSAMSAGIDIDLLGMKVFGVGTTESVRGSTGAQSGIEISYFRNTVLTADNQRALGRAYWGPLGDIFVVAVNPRFAVDRRADGTLFYNTTGIDQVVVVPAYKLLRPGDDPVIAGIPADVRRRLLELDPFLHNLDRFFPDSGSPLSDAANPHADPSPGNRAECLGRWWLNAGTELAYSVGDARTLKSGETSETEFLSTVSIDEGMKIPLFNVIGVGARAGTEFGTMVGLQSSKETVARTSRTAGCSLVRSQNERDLDAVEIYYDKVFSTLMFRRIPAHRRSVKGTVTGIGGVRLGRLTVTLVRPDETIEETLTSAAGEFTLTSEVEGPHIIRAGDRQLETDLTGGPVQLRDVRPTLSLDTAALWEARERLRVPSEYAREVQQQLSRIFDMTDLAYLCRFTAGDRAAAEHRAVIELPRTPLAGLSDLSAKDAERLEQAGVGSRQELWRETRSPEGAAALAERTSVPVGRLAAWQEALDRSRASVALTLPPPDRLRVPWWLAWLRRLWRFLRALLRAR
ncbi:hypothetical protein [Streptomyces prunicolor]|uniref:hypothetical protein n=1 Tax=Streptomyces prunicolor TaxID=67348 RepID=UPI0033D86518